MQISIILRVIPIEIQKKYKIEAPYCTLYTVLPTLSTIFLLKITLLFKSSAAGEKHLQLEEILNILVEITNFIKEM